MYILGIRLSEPEPDPVSFKKVGETTCPVCGVSYSLHIRVVDSDAQAIAKACLKFTEFLSHSTMHQDGHLSKIPLAMGLGDL